MCDCARCGHHYTTFAAAFTSAQSRGAPTCCGPDGCRFGPTHQRPQGESCTRWLAICGPSAQHQIQTKHDVRAAEHCRTYTPRRECAVIARTSTTHCANGLSGCNSRDSASDCKRGQMRSRVIPNVPSHHAGNATVPSRRMYQTHRKNQFAAPAQVRRRPKARRPPGAL